MMRTSYPRQEPIAIVGMACRFPGSNGIADFWRQLVAGANAVMEGPRGSVIGRTGQLFAQSNLKNDACRFGALVDDIDRFDADFFRISPIEAQMLDPQQRMMLETTWQALEDAAIDPETLHGSRTGIYAGISNYDYREMVLDAPETVEPAAGLYAVTGTALNTAIGRVSFALGLVGPSMAIDTACSSSLVAIHQAVAGLQRRDADLALAGGVHLFLSGRPLELRANAGMLSPTGQCWTFDAAADGFVCGEGCGLVVLKRLDQAEADGDRIWAVIRGSSVNQDGASQGLTVPSGPSQEQAMEEALARAGLSPADVDYLEAHGTGTVVGDPIELTAAAAVYGRGREANRPVLIGSVKTNIGHLAPAAGVAGLIKTVLAMRHGVIPRHLNFENPNPRLDWDRLPVRVTDVMTDWPVHPHRPPLAGVNSFGWSGTNAHLLVQGYGARVQGAASARMSPPVGAALPVAAALPAAVARQPGESPGGRETRFLPLSGKSRLSVHNAATRYLSWLDERTAERPLESTTADPTLADMTWTAAIGRSHFADRAAVVFSDAMQLREQLKSLAEADPDAGPTARVATKVAFVFTGQGSQWPGMGEALYQREPVFRSILEHCDRLLDGERGDSLLDVMFGRGGTDGLLDEPAWTQPAIYALECGLAALWESLGVTPDVVVGHSLGELAAAQAAGVFSLEQGLRFAAVRGTLLGATRSDGAMAAVFASSARVAAAVDEQNVASDDVGLSVAVDNGLQQVVSGPAQDVEAVLTRFEAEAVKVRRLRRSPAYHSALVDPALDALEAAVKEIVGTPPAPSVPLVSNMTGRLQPDVRMDAAYWRRHAREPVAFRSCVETLAEIGVDTVVEVGPHAVLGPVVAMTWPAAAAGDPVVLQSLRRPPRDADEPVVDTSGGFVEAVAGAYEAGLEMAFGGLFVGERRRRISLPGYPFQRTHHWVRTAKRRRQGQGHPLLGIRHESPRGEVTFETEMLPTDSPWLSDHLVYGRVVAPGALYGAMPVAASLADRSGPVAVDGVQMHSALIFEEEESGDGAQGAGRTLQLVLDRTADSSARRFEIFSKGEHDEDWTLHAEGMLSSDASGLAESAPVDLDAVRAELSPRDPGEFYRMRWSGEIHLGPSYHTLRAIRIGEGEALGELVLPDSVDANGMALHPLLLDGCFQISAIARHVMRVERGAVYLPFGWERLWVTGPMPKRIVCHATLRNRARENGADATPAGPPEFVIADVRLYSLHGAPLGVLQGYTAKRATRAALLSAREGLKDLLYEVVWREKPLGADMPRADFLAGPEAVARQSRTLTGYLADEGVEAPDRASFLRDLERLSRAYTLSALERLGWVRKTGAIVDPEILRRQLNVTDDHRRLFGRLLRVLSDAGILTAPGARSAVAVGTGDRLPDESLADPESFAERLGERHPHGVNELGLLRRCGSALAGVLQGREDPLALLFSDDGPSAADLYLNAPASRAANRMLAEAVAVAVSGLPEGRRLRVLEVGAGTGSATEAILPVLPSDRFEYAFTDISAGFFTQAEGRLAATGAAIDYRPLDLEADPLAQGFDSHGYHLVIAANVLHATRDLQETLTHCRDLLAPSGLLVALEGLQRRAWQDLTFGLLDGWWRFSDIYRPDHALATPDVWQRALADAGFSDIAFVGPAKSGTDEPLGSSVIIARGPAEAALSPGTWVLAADRGGAAAKLAADLAARGQTVLLADGAAATGVPDGTPGTGRGVVTTAVDATDRASWRSLLERLPKDVPLKGVAHLVALDGHGSTATTDDMAADVTRAGRSALALVQGVIDAGATPTEGVWFVTHGAQVLEPDFVGRTSGELAGATLWGFGKVMAKEAAHLQPRLIDLDPVGAAEAAAELVDEMLFPDAETHVAHRGGSRHAARLVRGGTSNGRLALPEGEEWGIGPEDPAAGRDALQVKPRPRQALQPDEVRIAVEAAGLNFADLLLSMGAVENTLEIGREAYGRVLERGADVEGLAAGDPVVAIGFGGFTPEMVTKAILAVPAPAGFPGPALATVSTCFVTAELAFELAGVEAGERILVHAGAGGVGLAAIQLAHAAGAEVFATASAPKQPYLRSLGVDHVFDSRTTRFGEQILDATHGAGVDVVLNSLTGEGFIEATLSCLSSGGRFVEIAKRGIRSQRDMSASRPDVAYAILDVDALKRSEPARPGSSLARIMKRVAAGELTPLPHTVWPLAEIGSAMEVMRAGRHIGKNVLRMPPLAGDRLRPDRTYLVTGGLGGIGCAVARWLAGHGAGSIVLNGRRDPDPAAAELVRQLRADGVDVCVEVADVTDRAAVDDLLARVDATLPPLGGVIHSVGVLSDGALENQTWERFERVLWPKVLGAWHLHQATRSRDLDLFVLFSSVTGVVGNSGQANHGAANAFLDQLAAHRRASGLPGQAIAWGAWSGIGEAEEQRDRIEQQLAHTGAGWITPEQGVKALDWLIRQDLTAPAVTAIDWSVIADGPDDRPPFLEDLIVTPGDSVPEREESAPASDLLARLRDAPAEEQRNLLTDFIQQELQAVLRLTSPPSASVSFFDLGMDSLMAVELRNRLNRAFATAYTAANTVVFDYPNAADLSDHLAQEIGSLTGSAPVAEQPAADLRRPAGAERGQVQDGIAIVGIACRFPGAPDLNAFWRQMAAGESAVTDGRRDSGSWAGVLGDPAAEDPVYRRGAFLERIDWFDSRFFGIRPVEARMMDPQQRLLLETSWQAIEDAGLDPERLKGSRTGVYAGVGGSEYRDLLTSRGQDYSYGGTNGAVTVGRVAFTLGLEGPALPLDLTCASSVAAVHQAVVSLQRSEVDLALAGGVNVTLSPQVSRNLMELGMLSASGRCNAFAAAADGFVRGEGCGMLVLKRLRDAEADGDRIWGVVLGSAVNQNGVSAGLMSPNGPAQEHVMEEALARAGVAPSDVDYLEAHAVGSEFGDPIEMNAVAAVYGRGRAAEQPLLVGSVKTNIGHLEWASGIASLIKTVLAMRHGVIPRTLHFEEPSPHLDWERLPVHVVSATTDWPTDGGRPPLAAVNTFGLSGANAHVVVEGRGDHAGDNRFAWPMGAAHSVAFTEPGPDGSAGREALPARTTRFLPLSGKSPAALRELAGRYLQFVDERVGASSQPAADGFLADVAWTGGVGRGHFPYRAGVVFRDVAQLREGLATLTAGDREADSRDPAEATTVAFAYPGQDGRLLSVGRTLYDSEPVVKALLDRCSDVLLSERGVRLLDAMSDPAATGPEAPALYALQCALTALWKSVGIRPRLVVGSGAGELAAAQAAGTLSLEGGLRHAATHGGLPAATPERLKLSAPSVPMVSRVGRILEPAEACDAAYWDCLDPDPSAIPDCAAAMAEFGVDVVVEIGPGTAFGEAVLHRRSAPGTHDPHPPRTLGSVGRRSDNAAGAGPDGGFAAAAAAAYEAGLDLAFTGLFAGEARRRVALPSYPFQRRRHWVDHRGAEEES